MKEFVKVGCYPRAFWPNDEKPLWYWIHIRPGDSMPNTRDYMTLKRACQEAKAYAAAHSLTVVVEE